MRLKDHPKDQLLVSAGKGKAPRQRVQQVRTRQLSLATKTTMLWQAFRTGFAENYKPVSADIFAQAVAVGAFLAFVILAVLWSVP
jgi:hypothetical protein